MSEEKKPFISSKTVWFISEIVKARIREATFKHLREFHAVQVPAEVVDFYKDKADRLEQSYAEYRQKQETKT